MKRLIVIAEVVIAFWLTFLGGGTLSTIQATRLKSASKAAADCKDSLADYNALIAKSPVHAFCGEQGCRRLATRKQTYNNGATLYRCDEDDFPTFVTEDRHSDTSGFRTLQDCLESGNIDTSATPFIWFLAICEFALFSLLPMLMSLSPGQRDREGTLKASLVMATIGMVLPFFWKIMFIT
jgi:hypothetical protein